MDSFFFLTTVAAAIGLWTLLRQLWTLLRKLWTLLRKLRFHQDNEEKDSSSSSSSSSLSSSLSPSSVPPLSSSRIWTHHVFPSFRGEDVRRDFLSHIQMEFQRKGITPFIDNEIKRGESIGPELIKAIRESKIAIILLSRNYASSKWCLEELVEIMKCREELGQTVMAIFYKVDPSDVNKLKGDFGKVFRKTCAGRKKEDTERWRQALAKVATIAGYHSSNWENEAAMIKKIVNDISNMLNNFTPSSDFDGLVGMRAHLEKMEPLLCLDSDEVRMIGIWGPPGIGKTTIARVAYNQFSNSFQLIVFMDDIKANNTRLCSDDYSAKLQLQQQFMSRITNHKDIEVPHLGVASNRLKDKKVLVVLDGVDQLVQLDAMAEKTWWFGPGSRIIITTQDQRLFRAHGINHIYKVGFPSTDEALQILCMSAFGQNSPKYGFEGLAREVTKLVGELPLGLRVMGSYFRGMSKQEWTDSLPRLKSSLNADIRSILKFSYDALDDEDKYLFLHIACLFSSEKIHKVEEHLAKKFLKVRQRLNVLAEKSLISFGWGYNIRMHSLLVKLGREIVCTQSIDDPGQRLFLHDERDICEVLTSDATPSKSVIGIQFDSDRIKEELHISENTLEGMSNLQFLRFQGYGDTLKLSRGLNYLSHKLRLLHWCRFPMTYFPSIVNLEFLVEIIMDESKLEKLWEGIKLLPSLKWMDLSRSVNLEGLPDLSTATNLQKLNLNGCSSLVKLPSTNGYTNNLEKLDLGDCSNLVKLPHSIGNLQKLRRLILGGCGKLEVLPTNINLDSLDELDLRGCSSLDLGGCSFIGNAVNLRKLDMSNLPKLLELLSSIGNATNLQTLVLRNCSNLVELPLSIGNLQKLQRLILRGCGKLEVLPTNINLESLDELDLSGCTSLDLGGCSFIGNAINLEKLDMSSLPKLSELPSSIGNATNLRTLVLSNCSNLVELPLSIRNLQKLRRLILRGCGKLEVLPTNINLESLDELDLSGCTSLDLGGCSFIGNAINLRELDMSSLPKLLELPSSIGNATNLEELDLSNCSNLVKLPLSIGNLQKLRKLILRGCGKLEVLPSSIGNATNLEELVLSNCSNLVELPLSIGNHQKLRRLILSGCDKLEVLPSSIGNATNLEKLDLSNCSNLVELPLSIGNLQKLRELILEGCGKLEVLPTNINLESLDMLDLRGCSMLKSFPDISTNISYLDLEGTAIEEVPPSIRSWPRLDYLCMSYFENLKEFPHALERITSLFLSDTEIHEFPPWVKRISRLREFVLRGCRKLVSLPPISDSINWVDAGDCESLEIIECSFHNPKVRLNFDNCFKLNQEARDLVIQGTSEYAVLPGREVPAYFTHRATGGGPLTIKLNERPLPTSVIFKACILLVNKGDDDDACYKEKSTQVYQNGVYSHTIFSPLAEHLYTFQVEAEVTSSELLLFEFKLESDDMWEIGECGLLQY